MVEFGSSGVEYSTFHSEWFHKLAVSRETRRTFTQTSALKLATITRSKRVASNGAKQSWWPLHLIPDSQLDLKHPDPERLRLRLECQLNARCVGKIEGQCTNPSTPQHFIPRYFVSRRFIPTFNFVDNSYQSDDISNQQLAIRDNWPSTFPSKPTKNLNPTEGCAPVFPLPRNKTHHTHQNYY